MGKWCLTLFTAEANYQFFRDAVVEATGRFGLGKMVSDPIYFARPGSEPRFDTISRVCAALGVRLVAQPVHGSA